MKKKKLTNKLYLSGKITDPNPKKHKENLAQFFVKEAELHDTWEVIFNPAELESEEKQSWEKYLARDLVWIAQNLPDLYMMKGWETSKGAKLEREFAKLLSLNIFYEEPYEGIKK